MSIPPIEIRWGGGKWPNGQKRAVRPTAEVARDYIMLGLESFGLSPEVPKTMTIWQASARFLQTERGMTHSAKNFDVNISVQDVRHRRVHRRLSLFTEIGFHEAVHAVRLEHQDGDDLYELAATEGLAYFTGGEFCASLMKPGEFDDVPAVVGGLSQRTIAHLREAFLEDAMADLQNPDDSMADIWLEEPLPDVGLPPGVIVGVHAVAAQVQANGRSIHELIRESAFGVLGIE